MRKGRVRTGKPSMNKLTTPLIVDDIVLTTFIDRMNRKMTEKLRKSRHLLSFDCGDFSYFEAFTSNDFLAEIFLDLCVPLTLYKGSEYPNTPIGALLSLSILPQDFNESYTHLSGTLDRVSASNNSKKGI